MFRIPLVAFATQSSVTHPPPMVLAAPSAHPMIVIVVPLWPCHGSYRREIQVFDKMLRCNQKSQALCSPTRAKMDQDVLSSEKQKPKKTCDVCAKKNNEESHGWGEGGGWGGAGARERRAPAGPLEDPRRILGGPLVDPCGPWGGPLGGWPLVDP